MNPLFNLFKLEFNQIGLNVIGISSGELWQDILPGCRSVIVFASGGRLLWDAFIEDCKLSHQNFTEEPHPLEAFIQRALTRIDPNPPQPPRPESPAP